MTIALLIVFSVLLSLSGMALICMGIGEWAAGREFEGLALPGDIAQALHAELEARWRRASLAQEV